MKTLLTPSLALALIIIGIFIGWILFSEIHCGKEDKTEISSTSDSSITENKFTDSTIQGTKGKDSLKYIPYPVYYTDSFFQQVDTAAILRDYYGTKVYTNRYITDHLDETIIDTVTQNKITGRKRTFTVTCYDTTINRVTAIRKSADGLYLGAETNLNYIGPDLMFIKGKWSYGGNIKFDPSTGFKAKEVNLRANYKIFGK